MNIITITATKASRQTRALLDGALEGKTYTITKYNKAYVFILPYSAIENPEGEIREEDATALFNHFGEFITDVYSGTTLLIKRNNKPIAWIVKKITEEDFEP